MRAPTRTAFAALAALLLSASACADDPLAPPAGDPQADFGTIGFLPPPDPNELVEITAGNSHTCVRRRDGRVYCWGLNNEGQTGNGASTMCAGGLPCADRPRLVSSSMFTSATEVDAGLNHTCALAPGGAAFCWGGGRPSGQVGNGLFGEFFEPQPVSGGRTFTSISAGWYSSCGTSSAGMFCWGQIQGSATAPALVSSFNRYSRVSVGRIHACAYFNESGWRTADCWGNNSFGQVGFDPLVAIQLPFTVGSGTGTDVNRVTTQGEFTCVDQGNTTVQCFGQNYWGTLGNGGRADTHIPQTVGNGQALRGVATGTIHACAIDPNGAGWCWGNGFHGQLGNQQQVVSRSPVPVTMPANVTFSAIAVGGRHSCAIGTYRPRYYYYGSTLPTSVYCWGDNTHGQLGRGTFAADPLLPQATIALQ